MISCPKCHRVSQEFDRGSAISQLSDDCDEQGCPAADGNVVTASQMMAAVEALPELTATQVRTVVYAAVSPINAMYEAPSKYRVCGITQSLPLYEEVWATSAQSLPDVVAALQRRIRDLQEQNERLAALVDEKERTAERLLAALTKATMLSLPSPVVISRAAVVRWVALSSGWHNWPCVTTGAKVPEREPHPLHRAIAVRKEGFPRG